MPTSSTPNFDPATHRKRVKHFEVGREARLLTFSCYQRRPLLTDVRWLGLLAASLNAAIERHGFLLPAFVFMPEHVHLVAIPWNESSLVENLLYAIKRPMSFRVKQQMERTADPLLVELTIRERPGKMSFRFWQEGPGHDRNLPDSDAMAEAIHYVHRNPVKRGLCARPDEYPWSSARQHATGEPAAGAPRVTPWSWWSGLRATTPGDPENRAFGGSSAGADRP